MSEKIKFEAPKPTEKEPEPQPEIETWEGEGGTVETQDETPAEVPETVVEEEQVKNAWQELVAQAKEEFPENIKRIIDKAVRKEKLTPEEIGALDSFSYHWFKEVFGIKVKKSNHKKN